MGKGLHIFSDGAARGNPGPAAIGLIIEDEKGNLLEEHSECIGIATNNVAEYTALIRALEHASKYSKEEIHCFCDSKLVVNQLNGIYKVRAKHLKELFLRVKDLEKRYKRVMFSYLSETDPKIAWVDKLVNKELESKL